MKSLQLKQSNQRQWHSASILQGGIGMPKNMVDTCALFTRNEYNYKRPEGIRMQEQ